MYNYNYNYIDSGKHQPRTRSSSCHSVFIRFVLFLWDSFKTITLQLDEQKGQKGGLLLHTWFYFLFHFFDNHTKTGYLYLSTFLFSKLDCNIVFSFILLDSHYCYLFGSHHWHDVFFFKNTTTNYVCTYSVKR